MRISKRSRQKFADLCADRAVLRTIREAFYAEDFVERDVQTGVMGERRALVAAFHADVDFESENDARRLLRVYLSGIEDWGRDWLSTKLSADAVALVRSLQRDEAPIDAEGNLLREPSSAVVMDLDRFERLPSPEVLIRHLQRVERDIAADPAGAIGSSKELLESTCKFILDDYQLAYEPSSSLPDLYKAASKALRIDRESVPDSREGSEPSRKILQNLVTTVQCMAELRNALGLGHGRTRNSAASERHARLAFNAARTVVEFLLDTWHVRRRSEASAA